ncbi:hypothetical protein IAT38_008347 [Cryptococcus sp. DSM 104549]
MSRYAPVSTQPDSPTVGGGHSRRSSLHSIRQFSLAPSRRQTGVPDSREMDAAFDGPPDGDDDDQGETETHGLLGRSSHSHVHDERDRMPGDYDFERDYTLPLESPPPFQPYSAQNPAPGNSHGVVPTSTPARPAPSPRHFLGGILPTAFLPRNPSPTLGSRVVGGGTSGVFGNLAARPERRIGESEGGVDYVPEDEQKDGPPSYQTALRDAVPPYWDTTVVLPSSSSPFGPLSSSMSGDEILIDGMGSGNFLAFAWNLVVSVSFQFVGFLLTYVLHTTHAAKYGSRAGLGITLIQIGLSLRSRAQALIDSHEFPSTVPTDPSDPDAPHIPTDEEVAENAIEAIWGPGASPWPAQFREPGMEDGPITTIHNTQEAEAFAIAHNTTLTKMLGLPSAEEVGRANEYFSFMLMCVGWFIVLTSVGGWWRVKRFERGLRAAQRESEAARASADATRNAEAEGGASTSEPGESSDEPEPITTAPSRRTSALAYVAEPFANFFEGARHIQRGFLGQHGGRFGRGGRGGGHTAVSQDEDDGEGVAAGEHELLDAQGFGLGPMAGEGPGEGYRRQRGLWG